MKAIGYSIIINILSKNCLRKIKTMRKGISYALSFHESPESGLEQVQTLFTAFRGPEPFLSVTLSTFRLLFVRSIRHDSEVVLNISSHSQMFYKVGYLKNLSKLIGKNLCWSLFLNKIASLMPAFY